MNALRTLKFSILRKALVAASAFFIAVSLLWVSVTFAAGTSGPTKLPADAPTDPAKISPAASDEELVQREKRRLEELFIWKMSEELKLSVETEGAFAEAIRSLNREKAKANVAVAEALNAIDKVQNSDRAKSKKEMEKAVKRYESAWRLYGALPLREVSRLRAILGPEKLGRYLVAKSVMAEKLTALSVKTAETEAGGGAKTEAGGGAKTEASGGARTEASGGAKKDASKTPTSKTGETK